MQIPYLPVQGRKEPHFIGVNIGPRMEICGILGLRIVMVPRLHQSNGYMKRKLRAWRVQKCITLVGAETVLTSAKLQNTPFHGGYYRSKIENMRKFGPFKFIRILHLHRSNGNIKRNLRAWRVQKCITLVGADTVLTSAGPQSTPFHVGWYRAQNGNMQNFGPTNPHGTAFAPNQW